VVNRVTCSAPVPSSILYVHACHPRGALPAHWACRMFSGPWGIVVVRASWLGHPTLIKKNILIIEISWFKSINVCFGRTYLNIYLTRMRLMITFKRTMISISCRFWKELKRSAIWFRAWFKKIKRLISRLVALL